MDNDRLKVLFVSSEAAPYAKSGGLGDVIGSLPTELLKQGLDVRIVIPRYGKIDDKYLEGIKYCDSFDVKLGWRRQSASVYSVTKDGVPVYLIQNDYYFSRDGYYGYGDDFERFAFFSKSAVEFLGIVDFKPDIIHCNDWQTGLVPLYLRDVYSSFVFFQDIKTLYTIHNLQYQGIFGMETLSNADLNPGYGGMDKLEFKGNISYMKAGLLYADAISTVSRTYAQEIQTPHFGYGMDGLLRARADRLFGITNGIDFKLFNPATDARIFENYDIGSLEKKAINKLKLQELLGLPASKSIPVFSIISRLTDQKGFDLVAGVMDELMAKNVQLVILGAGDGKYENMFHYFKSRYPDKLSVNIKFDETLAQRIYAGSDMFLMPSLFEPCGLGQIIAMRYGTVPIVRATGGLSDTVIHYDQESRSIATGFKFNDYLMSGLMWAINTALDVYTDSNPGEWRNVVKNAMSANFSWEKSASKYIELYEKIISGKPTE